MSVLILFENLLSLHPTATIKGSPTDMNSTDMISTTGVVKSFNVSLRIQLKQDQNPSDAPDNPLIPGDETKM